MATIGRTLFRFTGALLLGASATSIDNPGILGDATVSRRIATVPVVFASKDIPEGETIDRTALVVAQWPSDAIPAGAFWSVDSVAGRVTRFPVYKGEAVLPGRLSLYDIARAHEMTMTPGKRAFGIRVDDVAGIAGLVQPGSRVDIVVIVDDPARGTRVARLFMANMRVLAIGPAPQSQRNGRPVNGAVASIEVTPAEGERLAIAAAQGSLQLVLRGYGDADSINAQGATAKDLFRTLERSGLPPVRTTELRRTAAVTESPLCGVHVRPGVILRYALNIHCGDRDQNKIAAPPPTPVRPYSLTVRVIRDSLRERP
jgi:pilus assembly protein CpaB